jgi:hypothetical protein
MYYEQNAERICAYNRRYRQKRRLTHAKLAEQQNERNKLYQQTVKGQAALAAARLNTCAKKRLQRGKVTANDILNLPTHCQHCGKNGKFANRPRNTSHAWWAKYWQKPAKVMLPLSSCKD